MKAHELIKHLAININDTPERETLVFKFDKADQHYTVQIRHRERHVDVHLTREAPPEGVEPRTTLFKASFHQVGRFMVKVRKAVKQVERDLAQTNDPLAYFGVIRVNPGWFRRSFMVAMAADPDKMEQAGVVRKLRGGKRIRMGRNVLTIDPNKIFLPITVEMEQGLYLLQRESKRGSLLFAGFLFVLSKPGGKQFLVLPKARLNRFITDRGREAFKEELQGSMQGAVTMPRAALERFRPSKVLINEGRRDPAQR